MEVVTSEQILEQPKEEPPLLQKVQEFFRTPGRKVPPGLTVMRTTDGKVYIALNWLRHDIKDRSRGNPEGSGWLLPVRSSAELQQIIILLSEEDPWRDAQKKSLSAYGHRTNGNARVPFTEEIAFERVTYGTLSDAETIFFSDRVNSFFSRQNPHERRWELVTIKQSQVEKLTGYVRSLIRRFRLRHRL